jgi:CheY-like chemotaxis protein
LGERPADGKKPEGLRILVVDDDEDMRKLICAKLRRMNIDLIVEAQNGEEALERLSAPRELSQ